MLLECVYLKQDPGIDLSTSCVFDANLREMCVVADGVPIGYCFRAVWVFSDSTHKACFGPIRAVLPNHGIKCRFGGSHTRQQRTIQILYLLVDPVYLGFPFLPHLAVVVSEKISWITEAKVQDIAHRRLCMHICVPCKS